jgi:hypothetical protein
LSDDRSHRAPWRDAALAGSGLAAAGSAVWLLPASIHIVSWPASGPVRLALLAPAWQLAVAVVCAVVAGAAIIVAGWGRRAARVIGPLSLLWLWAIPYLPWLPDRAPLLLVLSGPLRWVVLAVAAGIVAGRLAPRVQVMESGLSWIFKINRTAIFAVSLVLYVVLGLHAVRTVGLGGDEPHYLIITESLLKDRDLRIENNHQRGDYRGFIGGELRPDYMQRGKDGEIYSIHAPGLAVLVLPVYAVAGHLGVVAFIGLLGALTALAIFNLAEALAGARVAVVTWIAVCLTVPFVPYSWMIFPEMPGALIVAWAAGWIWHQTEESRSRWFVHGAALAALPWLHTKFAVFLAIFALALAWKLRRQFQNLVAFALPIAVSGLSWLYFFYAIYGDFSPDAPYGVYSDVNVINRYIPHGLLGIFLDQKFGLLFYSPIYLLAIWGAWLLWRRPDTRFLAGVLFAAVAVFVGSTARLYMFWGGNSAPARFLVPILPCLAPMLALALARAQSVFARALAGTWLLIGVSLAVLGTIWPEQLMLFSDPHGRARILESIQAGSPLALVVPTFTDPDWLSQVPQLLPWGVAAAIAFLAAWLIGRFSSSRPWHVATAAGVVLLLAAGLLTASPGAAVRNATALRGDTDVLWMFDGHRHRTLDYSTLGRVTPDEMQALTTMTLTGDVTPDTGYLAGPLALPPGGFDALVSFASALGREGEIVIDAPPRAIFGRTIGVLSNPATVHFELPVAVRRLRLRVADATVGAAVSRVQIVPRSIVPPGEREDVAVRTIESIPQTGRGYIGYVDDHAYPEGGVFWTRGTDASEVLVAPGDASRIVLTLSLGPMAGDVILATSGREQRVGIPANESRQVRLDVPSGQRVVRIRVQSPVTFRPADVDPSSKDMRRLGCQVRVTLE